MAQSGCDLFQIENEMATIRDCEDDELCRRHVPGLTYWLKRILPCSIDHWLRRAGPRLIAPREQRLA
jgi:hypothetical protein